MRKLFVAVCFVAACTCISAQWVKFPSEGIPRNRDGSPNLTAPAPTTVDGKPDLSGVWDTEKNRACNHECDGASQEYFNLGWGLKGGLPYQPWARELVKSRMAANGVDDPGTHCLPIGFLRLYTDEFYRKIVQLPGLIVMLNERNTTYRQIFTDGRTLPADPNPSWNGYSIGKWDKDALVIETNGFRDGEWLDRNGSPLSTDAKVTERLRRVNVGRIEVEIAVNDLKTYTQPWSVKLNLLLMPNSDLLDYTCLENEKDTSHFVAK